MRVLRPLIGVVWLLVFAAFWLPAGPQTARDADAQGRGPASAVVAEGHVVATTADAILTSITPDQLGAVQSHDRLTVRVAGRALTTRFFDAARYAALLASPEAREGLDVDVVCTVDARGALVIVGLGGGLGDWLAARPGTDVIIEMP
ncbi:MAG: hypothetical protein HYY95_28085 [Candidatus Rokubacteria bacterium]|nr:hypothetical protein [Candidatus Rokubacteria bacterium]